MKAKLIALLLVLALLLCACSLGPATREQSAETSSESTESVIDSDSSTESSEAEHSIPPETRAEAAARLLAADDLITDLFVRGSATAAEAYKSFDDISELLFSTYAEGCGATEYYLGFPAYGESAVTCAADGSAIYNRSYTVSAARWPAFTVDGTGVTAGDITIPLIETADGLRLGGSYFIEMQKKLECPVGKYMNSGSAKTLDGNILAITLFLSANGGDYAGAEAQGARVSSTLDWLEAQASVNGKSLKFTRESLVYRHRSSIYINAESPFELELIFASTSFTSLEGLISASFDTSAYDGFFVVVCTEGFDGCFALPYTAADADAFSCERIVFGADATSDAATSAILELFGAEAIDDPILLRYMPEDICCDGVRMTTGTVRELNAFRIGWLNTIDPQLFGYIGK